MAIDACGGTYPPKGSKHFLLTLSLVASNACVAAHDQFEIKYTRDFKRGPMTVSVFGALEDGLATTEAWDLIGARMSQGLHQVACEPIYGQRLEAEHPGLFASIESAIRDEGVSDRWLGAVSARALGEFVIVFEVHTRVSRTLGDNSDGLGILIAHGGGEPSYPPIQMGKEPRVSQMTATFYSVSRRSVEARMVMQYWDLPADTAALRFSQRLASEFPEATCRGWSWKVAPSTERTVP